MVHGLRGVVADVYVDGQLVLPAFEPERVTDPIALPAGPHRVEIRVVGTPAGDPPAVTGDVEVVADVRQSIVAHLDSAGTPTITPYLDDDTPVDPGAARAVIRHAAAAPPVDVTFDDAVVAPALAEPGSSAATLPAGAREVAVWSPGTRTPVVAPQTANLAEGTSTAMYLIGSASAGTLSWIAEQVPGMVTPPTQIQTGDSGLAATSEGGRWVPVVGGLGAAVLAAVAIALAAHRRSRLA